MKLKVCAAEAVHVAIARRDAAVAHHHRDLVQRLGQQRPVVPVGLALRMVGTRVAFDRMVGSGTGGSRMKNTGVLLPTMSQLPSSV